MIHTLSFVRQAQYRRLANISTISVQNKIPEFLSCNTYIPAKPILLRYLYNFPRNHEFNQSTVLSLAVRRSCF